MELRPATEADRAAVMALGVEEEAVWFGEPEVSAEEVAEWVDSEGGLAGGVVAVDADGRVRGFAAPGHHEQILLADPAATDALVDLLVPWLRAQRPTVRLLTFGGDRARLAALERHGMRHLRSSFTLARPAGAGPLPAARVPDGVEVSRYRLGDDDEAVHRLIYTDAAWGSVPGHTVRDLQELRTFLQPLGTLLLARRSGRPVGWVAGRVLDSGRGFIQTLAVATDERGRGLGLALLLHGLADLQAAGAGDLTLGVEADNEAALGLYRSVGLEVEREWRTYASAP